MIKEEWIKRFSDCMRPHVNDAPTIESLESFLMLEATWAYEVCDYNNMLPEDAAEAVVDAIKSMS